MSQESRAGGKRPATIDIGIGDPEAPANAIPNVLANLVETETWRNAATVMMGLLLLALGYWAHNGVRDAIARTQAAGLDSILGTVSRGVDVWVNEFRLDIQRLASHAPIAEAAARLATAARDDLASACQREDRDELQRLVPKLVASPDEAAFLIIDREGRVLATNLPIPCGERVRSAAFRQRLDRTLDGAPQFVRPQPDPELTLEVGNGLPRPLAWLLAPVLRSPDKDVATDAGVPAPSAPVVAVLAIGVLADREFARLFASAHVGTTTEAYAFGDDGLMLTSTRFANQRVEDGYFPNRYGSGIFTVPVRDPGGDLLTGHVSEVEPAARPLTHAAALAVAARGKTNEAEQQGMLIVPYRSYSGREVLGAWRWLPVYDVGIVAERDTSEAFSALRYLHISFSVIGGFVILSLIAALTSGMSLDSLRRHFGRLQKLGAYTLERELSEGGMATIYLARHALLKRPTAVKVLKKTLGNDEFVHRFEREVQLASQLRHPNTVQIYDFGRNSEGQPYYVMEYLEGITLTELIRHAGPLPPGRVIHVLRQVAAALREAHERGMIHRDVKPDNIMLCRRGEDDFVKLLDFGLVKNIEGEASRDVTKQLKLLGTPRYMSPERIRDPADVDARSDIYALGAVGYFLLAAKHLFEGDDSLDISNQVLYTPAPRVSQSIPTVPEALDALIDACLAKERAMRPANADAVIEALDRLASRLAWTQRDASAWWNEYRNADAKPRVPHAAGIR